MDGDVAVGLGERGDAGCRINEISAGAVLGEGVVNRLVEVGRRRRFVPLIFGVDDADRLLISILDYNVDVICNVVAQRLTEVGVDCV